MTEAARRRSMIALITALVCLGPSVSRSDTAAVARPVLASAEAERVPYAGRAGMLGVAHAGSRLVSVGAHGTVMLSDDGGAHFHQARHVPTTATLTSVEFTDARNGWAVGNWGIILATHDGGETWVVQRQDLSVDRPLFTVHFINSQQGWAGGLWSLLLRTADGGAHWTSVSLPKPPGADKTDVNFYGLFPAPDGSLYIVAEQGKLLGSNNHGASWHYIETGYTGSFWTGLALHDGALLIGGLRGTIYRSGDGGRSWKKSTTNSQSSVTGFVQLADGSVVASALDGISLRSRDDGISFAASQNPDRVSLTGVASPDGRSLVFLSEEGLIAPILPVIKGSERQKP